MGDLVTTGGGTLNHDTDGNLQFKHWGESFPREDPPAFRINFETAQYKIEGEGTSSDACRVYTKQNGEWVQVPGLVKAVIELDTMKEPFGIPRLLLETIIVGELDAIDRSKG